MRRKGRPPAWTHAEREQVLALAEEGVTQRAIAEQVFGDARYRGRVERILRDEAIGRRELPQLASAPAEIDEAFDARDVSVARMLVARYERSLAESEEAPPLSDIERLLRIKRTLDTRETLERYRKLRRSAGRD